MNLNLIAYIIFLTVIIFIIIVVGRLCYRNGNVYVSALLPGHENLCYRVNKMLLLGYYLLNIGYAAMTIVNWETVTSLPQLIELIAFRLALIIGILSVLHYTNIFLLTKYVQKLIQ